MTNQGPGDEIDFEADDFDHEWYQFCEDNYPSTEIRQSQDLAMMALADLSRNHVAPILIGLLDRAHWDEALGAFKSDGDAGMLASYPGCPVTIPATKKALISMEAVGLVKATYFAPRDKPRRSSKPEKPSISGYEIYTDLIFAPTKEVLQLFGHQELPDHVSFILQKAAERMEARAAYAAMAELDGIADQLEHVLKGGTIQ
jgi:hypothetical protein